MGLEVKEDAKKNLRIDEKGMTPIYAKWTYVHEFK